MPDPKRGASVFSLDFGSVGICGDSKQAFQDPQVEFERCLASSPLGVFPLASQKLSEESDFVSADAARSMDLRLTSAADFKAELRIGDPRSAVPAEPSLIQGHEQIGDSGDKASGGSQLIPDEPLD